MYREGEYGEWLREALSKAGMTQGDLAEALAVSETTVNRWVNGKQGPPAAKRRRIEQILSPDQGVYAQGVREQPVEYGEQTPPRIPLYMMGHVAGTTDGEPQLIEQLEVTPRMARLANAAFVIHGTSMEPYFRDDDIVLIAYGQEVKPEQLVLARVENELTFKRFDGIRDGMVVLAPLNSAHSVILSREVTIVGVYRWTIRESLDGRL